MDLISRVVPENTIKFDVICTFLLKLFLSSLTLLPLHRRIQPSNFLYLLALSQLYITPGYVDASFQSRRPSFLPSKPCDIPCHNGGTCVDGVCRCIPGWSGPQCENCIGRVKWTFDFSAIIKINFLRKKLSELQSIGTITDGPNNYGASARCIWVIENDDSSTKGALLFKLDDFFTECCWDMLYIYDGNGVYGDLLGVFR